MKEFKPEDEIPECLWEALQKARPNIGDFRSYLETLKKEELVELFQCFVDAKTELADVLANKPEIKSTSEDAIDDLADALVTQGRDAYLGIYYGRTSVPDRHSWEGLKRIGHLFSIVFFERFDGNIYDVLDASA